MKTLGLAHLAGLAALAAMSGGVRPYERPLRRYHEPLGPHYPTTRQQRRAMERKARS